MIAFQDEVSFSAVEHSIAIDPHMRGARLGWKRLMAMSLKQAIR